MVLRFLKMENEDIYNGVVEVRENEMEYIKILLLFLMVNILGRGLKCRVFY
jgi:hypothetical protein